jgi:hypothetical protein
LPAAYSLHIEHTMQVRRHNRVLGALLVAALLGSSAAHGWLLVRCGMTLRTSCCCHKDAPPASSSALTQDLRQCCDSFAVPAPLAQKVEAGGPDSLAPMLVVAPGHCSGIALSSLEGPRPAAPVDPPPGPSLVLANCSLLI